MDGGFASDVQVLCSSDMNACNFPVGLWLARVVEEVEPPFI